jgi:zinc transporter 1/2/3
VENTCERVDRDYNINLRVGLLFAMLATSAIGVFSPILVASYVSPSHPVFTVLRQFGTGVIISTAFVHVSDGKPGSPQTDTNVVIALHARQPHVHQ